jgi:hypothetical protein
MRAWLSANRLKFFSFCAVAGDFFTGLGGASTFFIHDSGIGILLMLGGLMSLSGHSVLFIWGKGAEDKKLTRKSGALEASFIRPLMPWRYPLDFGFFIFSLSGLVYAAWGIGTGNIPMVLVGALLCIASLLGWLYPQDKKIFGLRAVQVTAIMYIGASVNTFLAGIVADNIFIIISASIYGLGNAVLFTTRKEHQSTYTQSH